MRCLRLCLLLNLLVVISKAPRMSPMSQKQTLKLYKILLKDNGTVKLWRDLFNTQEFTYKSVIVLTPLL